MLRQVRTLGGRMNCASILPIASLLVAIPLASAIAQDTVSRPAQNAVVLSPHRFEAGHQCPVELHAKHILGSSLLEAGASAPSHPGPAIDGVILDEKTAPPAGQNQQVQLSVSNPSFRDIVGVQMTVHGLSSKWRTVPLSLVSAAPDLSKTIDVALDLKGNGHVAKDLSLRHFTTVTSIDLTSITYADGSTWHASHTSESGACSITPDPLMLISASK